MNLTGRPVRRDLQGLTHYAFSWGETFFDVLCETYTMQTRRDTDEPAGTAATCVRCWYLIINKGAKWEGEA